MSADVPKLPAVLEKAIDTVLAYKPKPKTKSAKKRKASQKKKSLLRSPARRTNAKFEPKQERGE
jgi:hypothetical protein